MKDRFLRVSVKMQLLLDEEGQDLIEYALLVSLVALAATTGMKALSASLNAAFSHIGTKLTTYIT